VVIQRAGGVLGCWLPIGRRDQPRIGKFWAISGDLLWMPSMRAISRGSALSWWFQVMAVEMSVVVRPRMAV
jgi:hypothetical protein